MKKRILCMFMVLLMVFSMIPIEAIAIVNTITSNTENGTNEVQTNDETIVSTTSSAITCSAITLTGTAILADKISTKDIDITYDEVKNLFTGELPVFTHKASKNTIGISLIINDLKDGETAKLVANNEEYPFVDNIASTGDENLLAEIGTYNWSIVIESSNGNITTYPLILTKKDNTCKSSRGAKADKFFATDNGNKYYIDEYIEGTVFQLDSNNNLTFKNKLDKNIYNYNVFITPCIESIKFGSTFNLVGLFPSVSVFKNYNVEIYANDKVILSTINSRIPSSLLFSSKLSKIDIPTSTSETIIKLAISEKSDPDILTEYYFIITKLTDESIELPTTKINNIELEKGFIFNQGNFDSEIFNYGIDYLKDQTNIEFTISIDESTKLYHTKISEENEIKKENGKYKYNANLNENKLDLITKNEIQINNHNVYITKKYNFQFNETELPIDKRGSHEPTPALRSDIDVVDRLVDYHPAKGLYAAIKPISDFDWMYKAETSWKNYATLGGFGGYMTFAFDNPIKNDPKNPMGTDFIIYGNNFGYAPEPGGVLVSSDGEIWYQLAGSMHYELTTKPNQKNTLLDGNEVCFTQIAEADEKDSSLINVGTLEPIYGYADVHKCSQIKNGEGSWPVTDTISPDIYNNNHINSIGDAFDLAWAVNEDGKPVKIDSIKYIRVYNAVDFEHPSFGTNSPELGTIVRAKAESEPVGITEDLISLKVHGQELLDQKNENNYYEVDLNDKQITNIQVEVQGHANDNIVINNTCYSENVIEYLLTKEDGSRMFRVLVQNGTKEPIIYTISVTGGGNSAANADLLNIILTPGDIVLNGKGVQDNTYNFNVANNVQRGKLNINSLNKYAKITLTSENFENPIIIESGKISDYLSFNEGENIYTLAVQSTDESVTKKYTIIINREKDESTSNTIKVYFTFTGDKLHGYDENNNPNPGHEVQIWIPKTSIEIPKGSTVKYVTDLILYNNNIKFDCTDGSYISKVFSPTENRWLGEFDNGHNSGWMYRHNGSIANEGYKTRVLNNNDEILWFYTDDYTKETGYEGNWEIENSSCSNISKNLINEKIIVSADELKKAKSLKIIGDITLTLDKAALDEIGIDNDMCVTIKKVTSSVISNEYRDIIGERPVFDIKIESANMNTLALSNSTIEISIPYTLAKNEKADCIFGYYINENGKAEKIINSKFDNTKNTLIIKTNHLSMYAVGYINNIIDFNDISKSDWYYNEVAFVVSKNLFNGTSETQFSPKAYMTRAMFLTVLHRMSGDTTFTNSYEWYSKGVDWAKAKNISDGNNLNEAITREQLITMLWRYSGCPTISDYTELNNYKDISEVSKWSMQAMIWAHKNNILTGRTEYTLAPKGHATRAEVTVLIQRFLNKESETNK